MTTVTTNQCRSPCVGQNACRHRMERWADQGSHLLRKTWNIFSLHAIEEHRTEHKRHNNRYTNVGAVVTSSRLVRCLFRLILLLNFFDSADCGACEIREFMTTCGETMSDPISIVWLGAFARETGLLKKSLRHILEVECYAYHTQILIKCSCALSWMFSCSRVENSK